MSAASGRNRARGYMIEGLKAAGVPVVESGGAVVHLIGYNDKPADLRADAAITVAMDTPYLLGSVRSGALLATYSSSQPSLAAAAAVIAGKAPARGRSPVPVRGLPYTNC